MKKISTTAFLFFISLITLSAQEVPEVQRTMLTKITATWCSNCGSWGWDFFEELIEDNEGEKAVFFGAHHSGDLVSSPGQAFSSNFNAPYQPYFYVGNQNMDVTGGNAATKRQEVKALVDANYLEAPIVNVGFESTLSGNELVVDTKTTFFQETIGDYYLGLYILENGVINNQVANSQTAEHPYVIRSSFSSGDFGIQLENGTITDGTEILKSFTVALDPSWNQDSITIAGIIWNYDAQDDTYNFVNVNSTKTLNTTTTSTSFIQSDVLEVNLFPTISKNSSTLELRLKQSNQDLTVQLFDLNGRALSTIHEGILSTGSHSIAIPLARYEAGVYLIHIIAADGTLLTKKLVKQ